MLQDAVVAGENRDFIGTDKGYVNQRLTLARQQADVERLFVAEPDAGVIVIGNG